jgi:UDP-N-acetylglucosamine 2-epimerase (non-hydrolysing)
MKIISIVGARPNFMKIAPIAEAISEQNRIGRGEIKHVIVHTGQHYDEKMSDLFFTDLGIPKPDVNLGVGSGSQAAQTADIMKRFEPVLHEQKPDYVLVVGDVNSTIACALVAAKVGVKVIHVEAGLRSFDRSMPEEINRVLTDAISDLLFITERSAEENLLREGIPKERIHFVGNVMIDTLLKHRKEAERSHILKTLDLEWNQNRTPRPYAVLTLHRPSNVDNPESLKGIFDALQEVSKSIPILFPVHPRTKNRIEEWGFSLGDRILALEPLGYIDFLYALANAKLVLTDSGGIQEETTVLGVPCLTLRENTERPVTITQGTNRLVGNNPRKIVHEAFNILKNGTGEFRIPELWDGKAAQRIVNILVSLQQ